MKTQKHLQVNDMIFKLKEGEEITSVLFDYIGDNPIIIIEGYTPGCDFCTTFYPDITISEWKGHEKNDIWTREENYNIISYEIVKD